MFETQVTVVGNVATTVKVWPLAGGQIVAKFRIASNERRRPPSAGGEWVTGDSLFVQVTCWRQLATNVLSSLSVGDPIIVRGRLYTDEFEIEGKRHTEMRLEARSVGPDLSRCTAAVTRLRRAVPAAPAPDAGEPEEPSDDQRERLGAGVEAGVGA
jgi:single-strand DNA-binding protein